MKVPYSAPYDAVKDAGLRDYRAPLEPETPQRWPRWIAGFVVIALLIGLAFVLIGCAWYYPPRAERNHLDAPHPSPERIAQLAADGKPQVSSGAWLRLSSPFVLAGDSVRLTCFFPITRDHRYLRLGLIDAVSPIRTFTHATNFDQLLIESVPCGDMSAICDSLATSNRVLVHLEQAFTAKGTCNEGGER